MAQSDLRKIISIFCTIMIVYNDITLQIFYFVFKNLIIRLRNV